MHTCIYERVIAKWLQVCFYIMVYMLLCNYALSRLNVNFLVIDNVSLLLFI